jgi:hypothetical protein
VATQVVALLQLTFVAGVPPKAIAVAPLVVAKPVPVIVTTVPPGAGPADGLIAVMVGADVP